MPLIVESGALGLEVKESFNQGDSHGHGHGYQ
jgi:hypothetical protein